MVVVEDPRFQSLGLDGAVKLIVLPALPVRVPPSVVVVPDRPVLLLSCPLNVPLWAVAPLELPKTVPFKPNSVTATLLNDEVSSGAGAYSTKLLLFLLSSTAVPSPWIRPKNTGELVMPPQDELPEPEEELPELLDEPLPEDELVPLLKLPQ